MANKTKLILYTALTITLMLLMADLVTFNLISHKGIFLNCECPDLSKHSEHSHTNYFEDEIPYIESITISFKSEILKDILLFANPDFRSSFYTEIWRPPKNS
jgi:hypothetical protein